MQCNNCIRGNEATKKSRNNNDLISITPMCGLCNPHRMRPSAAQQRFSVNIWNGILRGYFKGLHLQPSPLDGRSHLILQQVLPESLDAAQASSSLQCSMWSQHDRLHHIMEFTSTKNTST
ncbi:hypothetical protein TNCV_5103801 [Trichonephila clavipes]|nr:hypothetical protein TNCV_5103801 [Trichonephila clavipes]